MISYIEQGRIMQYDISSTGKKVVLNIFKPGAFFPAAAAVNASSSRFFYEALDDVLVRQTEPSVVRQFLLAKPDVVMDLLSRIYSGLDGLQEKLVLLLEGSAELRILNELTIQAERFGSKVLDGVEVHITEEVLSQMTGLSRETVSRNLKQLKERGVVALRRGVVTIL